MSKEHPHKLFGSDSIENFRNLTSLDSPYLERVMSNLVNQIPKEDFAEACRRFADGIEYVKDKFGTQPAGIFIIEESDKGCQHMGAYASSDSYSIHIPLSTFAQMLLDKDSDYYTSKKTAPFALSCMDNFEAIGVEEACHIKDAILSPQLVKLDNVYKKLDNLPGVHIPYNDLPMEANVIPVMRQWLLETKIAYHSPLAPYDNKVSDMAWAKEILEQRVGKPSTKIMDSHIAPEKLHREIALHKDNEIIR